MNTAAEVQIQRNSEAGGERERMNEGMEAIAGKILGFPTLESRNSDEMDFKIVSVWGLRAALEAAYNLGRASK